LSPCEKHKDHRATHPLSRTAPDNLPHSTFPTKEKTATPATPVSKTRKDALKEDKIKGTEEVKALKGNILAKKAKQIEPAGQIEKLVKKPGKTTSPRKPKPNGK
jgi:LmbE family N-acetylglucosaminyl deacetylase